MTLSEAIKEKIGTGELSPEEEAFLQELRFDEQPLPIDVEDHLYIEETP